MKTIRRNVVFESRAFNTTESKDYFRKEGCFGDDLARWLIEQLQVRGIQTESQPRQQGLGWYLTFRVGDTDYKFGIRYGPGESDEPEWNGTVERRAGAVGSIFGAAKHGIKPDALDLIHTVLSSSALTADVRWFVDEDFRRRQNGRETPTEP